jgi:hypothetical protein
MAVHAQRRAERRCRCSCKDLSAHLEALHHREGTRRKRKRERHAQERVDVRGPPLVLETGRMARQAHGACLVQYGETVALCTVTAQDRPTHLPFFPLTVEYRARSYAAGKIPGGFFKREGRPAEQEILSARLIDRPIRPLFPGRLPERDPGDGPRAVGGPGERRRRAEHAGHVGGPEPVEDPVRGADRGGAGRPDPGPVGAEPDVPAARVQRRRDRRGGHRGRHPDGRGRRGGGAGGRSPRAGVRRTRASSSCAGSSGSSWRACSSRRWSGSRSRSTNS